jgi:acyl-CoA synthetase (AMP-forming)/AMP-acid ligase II
MYLGTYARKNPDHPALIMAGSGETLTYGQLDAASNRLAHLLRSRGLGPGDHIAIFTENHPVFFDAMWAALRSGLYWTPINWHLTGEEAAYIINDCGARALLTSSSLAEVARELLDLTPGVEIRLMCDGRGAAPAKVEGYERYEDATAAYPVERIDDEIEGMQMMYSSGTTGRPKGILPPLPGIKPGDPHPLANPDTNTWGFGPDTAYLSPAPLYHAAPSVTSSLVHRWGGTVVCMERFDAADCLRYIERYRITHGQFVPTMFVRMLKLPEDERSRFDVSSLKLAIHAAAPCPIEVKRQMIEWWGPIIAEYYSGSENNGMTAIGSEEWLEHPGSVGRPQRGCTVHILDDEGTELPAGEIGTVWFESPNPRFVYHGDPEKTNSSYNERGWSTLGDVGRLDEQGYLYLTDRKAFMIISGGVNIYPQEAENLLVTHPKVLDVAVVGVPNTEMGEEVKAVVQPLHPDAAGPELEQELLDWLRERLAHYKCPKSIDFDPELPRLENGKLYKRLIKDRYWGGHDSRIV